MVSEIFIKSKKIIKKNIYKAFTLAEVLIVMGIVGLVAEMTIPSVVQNINEQTNFSAWKKTYSALSQAWLSIAQENGGTIGPMFTTTGTDLSNDYGNKMAEKLRFAKICQGTASTRPENACWHEANKSYTLSKQSINSNYSTRYSAILKDGTYLFVGSITNNCPDNNTACLYIAVDVNGAKGPNVQGKDIFYGNGYGGGRFTPHGAVGIDPSNSSDPYCCIDTVTGSSTVGQGCSQLALFCNKIDYSTGTCKN